jgi:general secretion pathway protein J
MTPAKSRQGGFTLLELLVGLVVLGFIMAGLSQATRYGLRATTAQQRLYDGRAELDAVDRTLRLLIGRIDPGNLHSGPALVGSAARMTFVSALPESVTGSAAGEANIALGLDGGHTLVIHWTAHVHATALSPPAPAAAELLRAVARVEFAYWRDGWQESWDQSQLPRLIRIRLTFPPGDLRHWPDIVIASVRQKAE